MPPDRVQRLAANRGVRFSPTPCVAGDVACDRCGVLVWLSDAEEEGDEVMVHVVVRGTRLSSAVGGSHSGTRYILRFDEGRWSLSGIATLYIGHGIPRADIC